MIRILIPLIALLLVVWFIRSYRMGSQEKRKRLVLFFFFMLLFSGVIFLTVTGRLHFIAAVVTALLPFAKKALPLLRYVPFVKRWVKVNKQSGNDQTQKQGQEGANTGSNERANERAQSQTGASQQSQGMTHKQALQVLGLTTDATAQEVVDAHKRLMQKCHPDRGGNDFLAAQLNQAKDTLLS